VSFDWEPFKVGSGGDFVKFETEGDEIVGTITALRKKRFKDQDRDTALIDIQPKDGGDVVTLACDKVDLRMQLAELEPQVGDLLAVRFTGTEKVANGRMKKFAVKHRAGAAPEPDPVPEPEYSDEPF
jgi:hypothetical protein